MALPIETVIPALHRALATHRNAVLVAPPGAGKTTRVPLALLEAPWLTGQRIVMLEPRRLAARAAAQHMAQSLGERAGETVGYRTRLDTKVGPRTRVEVVTEGVLTRMLQSDPALDGIGAVIFDEFHERNLQADLGLALCLQVQETLREDLRLLVMSATLDGAAVARLLGDAPQIVSEGRSFPVAVRHLGRPREMRAAWLDDVALAVQSALREESGSVLVFLPGTAEIRGVEQRLAAAHLPGDVIIAPLHGTLPPQAQALAIAPPPAGRRKVVLATNIAETSLTIEAVRVVVDAGQARVPRFDPRSGMTRLQTVLVSQASADQRCGRAGRLEPGVCYRLWNAGLHLLPSSTPEILEADLAPLALELAHWGVSDPAELRWLDAPSPASYAQARDLLQRLGALDAQGRITPHGRAMAALPLHPRLAHMVLRGRDLGLGVLACDIAALLGERDPLRNARQADLRLRLEAVRAAGKQDGVDIGALTRIREDARRLRSQLRLVDDKIDDALLSRCGVLLALAYPDRIGQRRPGREGRYLFANGRGGLLSDEDGLQTSSWLVAADVDAGERDARIFLAAAITPAEIEAFLAEAIEAVEFIAWDGREQAVLARRQRRLGQLLLEDTALARPDPERVVAAMLDGIRSLGLDCLPWTPALRNWQARVEFLHRLVPQEWPDVSDAALLGNIADWLGPYLTGVSRRSHLQDVDLANALEGLLSWEQQRALEELAPMHIAVPSGSRIALDYDNDPPVLAVRLQEMFGAVDTPRIAGGRVAVLLHLLSPARRPVQVTQDLAGFWARGYIEVKKDLKGRYPKHYWPDDPLQAEPTARAKPRV